MQCHDCGAILPSEARFCLSCGARVASVPARDTDPLLEALTKAIGFQYWIERLLGRGGMGAVYLAHELALDRDVAIKVLPPGQAATPQARERFRREALVPSDEEADFSPPARVTNTIGTTVLPLTCAALAHVRLFAALNPGVGSVRRLTGALAGAAIGLIVMSAALAVRLRLQGLDWSSIARKALQQPSWSRSWHPRAFRPRGDVWDLLPRRLRQYRAARGVLLTYVWVVFIPLQVWTMWVQQLPALRQLLLAVAVAGIALMLALRRRAATPVQANLHVTAAEAAALLNTPTWRVSTGRRPPASSLLSGRPPTPPRAGMGPDEAPTTL